MGFRDTNHLGGATGMRLSWLDCRLDESFESLARRPWRFARTTQHSLDAFAHAQAPRALLRAFVVDTARGGFESLQEMAPTSDVFENEDDEGSVEPIMSTPAIGRFGDRWLS